MMKTYAITSQRFEGQILFKYGINGNLIGFEIEAELSDVQLTWLYQRLPLTYPELVQFSKAPNSQMKLVEVPQDLSFETFWQRYNYKVGKAEAEKAWGKLAEVDKSLALQRIAAYDGFLMRKGTAKVWPERYIKKRYFDNNYAAL